MQSFAKVTKLSNVAGRGDYISNPERQEDIVVKSEPVDWKPYQQFERENQKTSVRNNEGREIVFALPNEWAKLDKNELARRVQTLAIVAVGKSTDMQWAVHWNKARTNLHAHVIFSERTRDRAPGTWDRDIYLTADGKVARRAADRARDKTGNVLPPVHRKGDLKGGFTAKDKRYVAKNWVENMKAEAAHVLRQFGATIDAPMPFHQYHEGKGADAPVIKNKNEAIKLNNRFYASAMERFGINMPPATKKAIRDRYVEICKQGKVGIVYENSRGGLSMRTVTREQLAFGTATPEQRVAKLLDVQRDVYARAYAIRDDRPPFPATFGKKQEAIRSAFAKYNAAKDAYFERVPTLQRDLQLLHVWQGGKKKKLMAEIEALRVPYHAAAQELYNAAFPDKPLLVEMRPQDIAGFAEIELRQCTFEDARDEGKYRHTSLEASPETLQAAQERFKALCEVLPSKEREKAFEALTAAHEEHKNADQPGMAAMKDVKDMIYAAFPAYVDRDRHMEINPLEDNDRRKAGQKTMAEWMGQIKERRASEPPRGTIRDVHPARSSHRDDHDDR